ncbi:MAG TPA: site-2 protease family protein [Tepidiformaceae bacterium]
MFGGSFRVARVFGIDIEIHFSWLVILGILAWALSEGFFPTQYEGWATSTYWIVGTISAVLLFLTVLIHELAHALVALRKGLEVPRITLFIFGGVSHLGRQPRTAGEEFFISAAGPLTSVLVAVVTAGLAWFFSTRNEQAEAVFTYLAFVNVLLAIFNTLPGFPLDGGRVLRSIVWKKTGSFRRATRVAGAVGQAFGYGIIVLGLLLFFTGNTFNGIWFALIGWFLLTAARAESGSLQLDAMLAGLTARDVMREEWVSVSPAASIQDVVDDHMLSGAERCVIVAREGAVLGLLTVSDVRKVSRDDWRNTPAQRVMTPRDQIVTVIPDARAVEVMRLLADKSLNQVPVIDAGRMIGLVTRRELVDRVKLTEQIGPQRSEAAERELDETVPR